MITIEKKIKDVIREDEWFIENHPTLKPYLGGYSPIGNTYPSIAYNLDSGASEPIIPANRTTLTFVIYSDKKKASYGECKKISDRLLDLFNRRPQNLTDISNGLRVVGCYKTGGAEFFNERVSKHGRDLIFSVCMSEDEDMESSSSSEEESSSSPSSSSS